MTELPPHFLKWKRYMTGSGPEGAEMGDKQDQIPLVDC